MFVKIQGARMFEPGEGGGEPGESIGIDLGSVNQQSTRNPNPHKGESVNIFSKYRLRERALNAG